LSQFPFAIERLHVDLLSLFLFVIIFSGQARRSSAYGLGKLTASGASATIRMQKVFFIITSPVRRFGLPPA
jgi:hypothetical protein